MGAMQVISSIQPRMRVRGRFDIALDGEYVCTLDVSKIRKLHLIEGEAFEEERLLHAARSERDGALSHALNRLAVSMRAEQDVRADLEKQGYLPEVIESVIEHLKQKHYIDDAEYAQRYVQRRVESGYGPIRIAQELKQRQIQTDLDVDATELEENAMRFAQKRWNATSDARKVTSALLRRGYSYALVKSILEKLTGDENPELDED